METPSQDYTLAELMISAASYAFKGRGEILATGITLLPRLAASLAMKTHSKDIMMTDSEAYLLSDPNPVGKLPEDFRPKRETWMGFSRIFDNVWSGKRHAMVAPSQIDRFGQANISCLGGSYDKPKVALLGVRGFPGNSICHGNSFFVPEHSKRVFVPECDMVSSIGYNQERLPKGYKLSDIDIGIIVTDLCVMDFKGKNHKPRIKSLHPGIEAAMVAEKTGFELEMQDDIPTTKAPTTHELSILKKLDPHGMRHKVIKENPKGDRSL